MARDPSRTKPIPQEAEPPDRSEPQRLALVEEELAVEKRLRERYVTVRTTTAEHEVPIEADLLEEEVTVERVATSRVVAAAEAPRMEGDVIVVPIHEERLVLRKELVVVGELRIRKLHRQRHHSAKASVRRERVVVERRPSGRAVDDGE